MIRKKIRNLKLWMISNMLVGEPIRKWPKRHSMATLQPFKVTPICFHFFIFNFRAISYWCFQLIRNFADWAFFEKIWRFESPAILPSILWFEATSIHLLDLASWVIQSLFDIYLVIFDSLTIFNEILNPWSSQLLTIEYENKILRIFDFQVYLTIFAFLEPFIRILKFLNHWVN